MTIVISFGADTAFEWHIETSFARLVSMADILLVALVVWSAMVLVAVVFPERPYTPAR